MEDTNHRANPLFYTLLSLAVVISVVFLLIRFTQKQNQISSLSGSSISAEQPPNYYKYTLGVFESKLAAFEYEKSEPLMIFDVYLQSLPDVDKQELKAGIHIRNYEELIRRIEDYIS